MGAVTAHLIFCTYDNWHSGIHPISSMYLYENDRPRWVLISPAVPRNTKIEKRVWIPTVENMIEDALLMFGYYVKKDEFLIEKLQSYVSQTDNERLMLYSVNKDIRNLLYDHLKKIRFPLIHFDTFNSVIRNKINVLKNYKIRLI